VALTMHITHYGPREGEIKIYKKGILWCKESGTHYTHYPLWSTGGGNQNLQKRYFMIQGEWHSLYTFPTIVPSLTQYYNLIIPIKSAHPICHLETHSRQL
jgi:hypothetical protein